MGNKCLKIKQDATDAIFPDASFVDCAVKVRKMDSVRDMLPLLAKGLKLTQRDIDDSPLKFDTTILRKMLEVIPDTNNDPMFGAVPDMVSNTVDPDLYNILAARLASEIRHRFGRADERVYDEIAKDDLGTFQVLNSIVASLTAQISFLWHSFHESKPNIATITRDAFDLVDGTKLQTNLTPDMLDKAFEHDMFLELPKPICGFMEFAFLRRGDFVYVIVGRKHKQKTVFDEVNGYCPAFLVVRPVSILKQIGTMTEESLSSTFMEGLEDIDRHMMEAFDQMYSGEDDYEQRREEAETRLKNMNVDVTPDELKVLSRLVGSAVIFATKMRLMLLVEKPPIDETFSTVGTSCSRDGVSTPPQRENGVSYSIVSLTKGFRDARAAYASRGGEINKFGKKIVEKFIAGFIRRQHYGQNNALVKTIFVAPFTNRFWMNEGLRITKIVK